MLCGHREKKEEKEFEDDEEEKQTTKINKTGGQGCKDSKRMKVYLDKLYIPFWSLTVDVRKEERPMTQSEVVTSLEFNHTNEQ